MDKHNKNEKTIVLRPTVDYRDPNQRDPCKPKPDYSGFETSAFLGNLAAQQAVTQDLNQPEQVCGWPLGSRF